MTTTFKETIVIDLNLEELREFNERLRLTAAENGPDFNDRLECLLYDVVTDINSTEAWHGAAELAQSIMAAAKVAASSPRELRGEIAIRSLIIMGGVAARIVEAYLEREAS